MYNGKVIMDLNDYEKMKDDIRKEYEEREDVMRQQRDEVIDEITKLIKNHKKRHSGKNAGGIQLSLNKDVLARLVFVAMDKIGLNKYEYDIDSIEFEYDEDISFGLAKCPNELVDKEEEEEE